MKIPELHKAVRGLCFSVRLGLLDLRVQFSTWLELDHVLRCDGDLFTGLRVAAFAGLTVRHGERAKANEGHTLATLEGAAGGIDESVEGAAGIGLADASTFGHGITEF